jgi:hypothetical protein
MSEFYFFMKALACVLCLCVVFPIAVYITVKMGTYAFFKGRQLFHEDQEKIDGEKK